MGNAVGENEHYLAFEGSEGTIFVAPRCKKCGLYVKTGEVQVNGLCEVRFCGWACKRHGSTEPIDWFWE